MGRPISPSEQILMTIQCYKSDQIPCLYLVNNLLGEANLLQNLLDLLLNDVFSEVVIVRHFLLDPVSLNT